MQKALELLNNGLITAEDYNTLKAKVMQELHFSATKDIHSNPEERLVRELQEFRSLKCHCAEKLASSENDLELNKALKLAIKRIRKRVNQTKGKEVIGNNPLNLVRSSLAQQGARGIIGLSRAFRISDEDGNGTLSKDEFRRLIKKYGNLTTSDCNELFSYFDRDGDGSVSCTEFLSAIRGKMNERRLVLVREAFDKFDKNHNGEVKVSYLVECYNAKEHPDVLSGKKTESEVLRDFVDTLLCENEKNVQGVIYPADFEHYYETLSASIDDDDYFEFMIKKTWHIISGECRKNTTSQRVVTDSSHKQVIDEVKNDFDKSNRKTMVEKLKRAGRNVPTEDANKRGKSSGGGMSSIVFG
eukprot:g3654.t1